MPQEEGASQPLPKSTPSPSGLQEQPANEQEIEPIKQEEIENLVTEIMQEKVIAEADTESDEFDAEHMSIFEEPNDNSVFPEINFDLDETGRWRDFKVVEDLIMGQSLLCNLPLHILSEQIRAAAI